ncbi:polypeptide N-acetylgalactosaminyltransferase 1-like [Prorops nasuta]|uniref:polypeptide N-acetylgalactosaminyltransferase 1-like n=1 Tax=Prorops nasuta TaxID=863751 RepID=UPI0034CE0C71
MITLRRRLIIKLIICITYLIGVIVIARKIFQKSKDDLQNKQHGVLSHFNKTISIANDLQLRFGKSTIREYEDWIEEYERNIVPGLGENGEPAYLGGLDKVKGEKAIAKKALNIILSNHISLTRKLADGRDPLCANVTYDHELPTASIIVIFYNEPWSVLIRTVKSVLTQSPPYLLKEIILVDDHSDEVELQGLLDYYVLTRLPQKVKLLRLKQRSGLIRARLHGAKNATGDVLVFLDAHCETNKDWLQPLLQRIKEKQNAVIMPIIDNISEETLEYMHDDRPQFFQVGGFTWSGHFTWINIQEKEIKSRSSLISPVKSPTMAGGLFAIDRKYFWEIGSYDDKMDGWGGENLEMSFRIWQCGGSLETIPCSRVGHIFRNFHPYKFPNDKDTHGINTARLAYVWMDDYKRLFLLHRSEFKYNPTIIGDTQERLQLRKSLKCKSFKWYLDNVYPEKFIPDENVVAYGRLKLRDRPLCLDNLQHDEDQPYNLGLYGCHNKLYPSQLFSLSNIGELRREETCARVISTKTDKYAHIQMSDCHAEQEGKEWILKNDKLINVETGLCLDATGLKSEQDLYVSMCSDAPDQIWLFDFYTNLSKSLLSED